MQAILSDTQIRANLRTVLARHRVDLNRTSFSCSRGVVRMLGELCRHGATAGKPVEMGEVEALERELQSVKGVSRVHFDLLNWRRLSTGEWQPVHKRERPQAAASHAAAESAEGRAAVLAAA